MKSFINEDILHETIKKYMNPNDAQVAKVLNEAKKLQGLNLSQAATLLNIQDTTQLQDLFATANKVKNDIYGNRLVIFAPLYVSSYCANNCLYCGFRKDNTEMERKKLSLNEVKEETKLLLEQGHKRVLMLMGEHPKEFSLDQFYEAMDVVYSVVDSKGSSIRRINIEIAPLTDDEFKVLATKKIGTYTVFQETYHTETYKQMHPSGKKSDLEWRLFSMDRALQNGLHDVGIGALFGLYDYRFETLALLSHAQHLDETFGVGPHTISIPRIEFAQNAPATIDIPHPVSDIDFKKLVAVLRCSVPYTGMILSTRETPKLRDEVLSLGISQISAGSKTNPGGYAANMLNPLAKEQFAVHDNRSTDDVLQSVIKSGFVPSFCTGCYRLGRVGKDFMDLAKPGLINLHCQPNALSTLKEYLLDYADPKTKELGEELIRKELGNIQNLKRKEQTEKVLEKIEAGKRDLYF